MASAKAWDTGESSGDDSTAAISAEKTRPEEGGEGESGDEKLILRARGRRMRKKSVDVKGEKRGQGEEERDEGEKKGQQGMEEGYGTAATMAAVDAGGEDVQGGEDEGEGAGDAGDDVELG